MANKQLLSVCLAALSLLPATPTAASGEPSPEPYSCRNGLFARQFSERQANGQSVALPGVKFALGKVKGKQRSYFFKDEADCPAGTGCQTSAYVLPGDLLLINQLTKDWACVWYQGKSQATVGWLPRRQLDLLPAPTPPSSKTGKAIGLLQRPRIFPCN